MIFKAKEITFKDFVQIVIIRCSALTTVLNVVRELLSC